MQGKGTSYRGVFFYIPILHVDMLRPKKFRVIGQRPIDAYIRDLIYVERLD